MAVILALMSCRCSILVLKSQITPPSIMLLHPMLFLQILLLSIFNKFWQVQYLDKNKIDFNFFIDCQTIHTLITTKLARMCFIKIQHGAKVPWLDRNMVDLKDGPNIVNKKCGIEQKNDSTIICEMVFKTYYNEQKMTNSSSK